MSDRDSSFPATSLRRTPLPTNNPLVARTTSRESLFADAALPPPPSSGPARRPASPSPAAYVPYVPRPRIATTANATNANANVANTTTTTAAVPTVQSGAISATPQMLPPAQTSAASRLQTTMTMSNLRAAAQSIGVEPGSIGWAILEKLSHHEHGAESTEELAEIWNALTKGKASLLLPLEPLVPHAKITAELIQDHTVVYDTTSRDDTPVITLSGIRGQLVNDVLTLRSTLTVSAKQLHDLFASPSTRSSVLDALPPLPFYPPESSYPTYTIPAYTSSLPLPPRPSRPPLPPRPSARSTPAQPLARPGLNFAAFFGQRQPTVSNATPLPSAPLLSMPSGSSSTSLPASSTPLSTISTEVVDSPVEISAFTISMSALKQGVATEIIAALQGEIAVSLGDQPPWLIERVQTFSSCIFPFVRAPVGKKKLQDLGGSPGGVKYVVNNARAGTPDELSHKVRRALTTKRRRRKFKGMTTREIVSAMCSRPSKRW